MEIYESDKKWMIVSVSVFTLLSSNLDGVALASKRHAPVQVQFALLGISSLDI